MQMKWVLKYLDVRVLISLGVPVRKMLESMCVCVCGSVAWGKIGQHRPTVCLSAANLLLAGRLQQGSFVRAMNALQWQKVGK